MSNQEQYPTSFRHSLTYGCELRVADLATMSGQACRNELFHDGNRRNLMGVNYSQDIASIAENVTAFADQHALVAIETNPRIRDLSPELGLLMLGEVAEVSDQAIQDATVVAELDNLVPEFER